MNTNHEQNAIAFLNKFSYAFRAKKIGNGPFWDGDTDRRDIYRLSIVGKGRRSVSFKFSASVTMSKNGEVPTAYDLLSCIQKDDPGTFEDFCKDFVYNTDSRKAEKAYRGVLREWKKVKAFFSTEEIDCLRDIS